MSCSLYVFKADHLVLDSWLCFSLGNSTSSSPSLPQWGFLGFLLSASFGMSSVAIAVLVQLMCKQLCWWDVMCVASAIPRRYTLAAYFLILWHLQSFQFLFFNVLQALDAEVFCRGIPDSMCCQASQHLNYWSNTFLFTTDDQFVFCIIT